MGSSVLVVEDYADLRSAIAKALLRGRYACEQATDAVDAIGRLKAQHYEAILLAPTLPVSEDPVVHFLIENQPDELHKLILMMDEAAAEYPTLVKPFGNAQLLAKLPPV